MKAKDLMHRGVVSVAPDTSVVAIARIMYDEDIGSVPVLDDGRLIGIVTDRDIVCRGVAKGKDSITLTASDVMTSNVYCCSADQDADDAVWIMESRRVRRLPVLNSKKRVVGILALGDICKQAGLTIAGEIVRAVSAHHVEHFKSSVFLVLSRPRSAAKQSVESC